MEISDYKLERVVGIVPFELLTKFSRSCRNQECEKKFVFFFLKVRERKKIILFEHKNFKQQTIVQCKLIIVKNTVRGLKEPVMFDDIQGYSCVGVCFMVVSETDDTIIVFRSFSPPTVC